MIFDIYENTSNGRDQISRIESKDMDQCVKMVLDHYVKPEFHENADIDYADDDLTYLTIIDNSEIDHSKECIEKNETQYDPANRECICEDFEDYEVESLTFEIHVSDDQENRSFKVVSGHDEFITLDENGKTKTPFSQGKLLDQARELEEKLNKN